MSRVKLIQFATYLNMTVGELIKEFIESKKDTVFKNVRDYKLMLDVSYNTLHKYYGNKRLPGYALLYKLQRAGMDISILFKRDVFINTITEWDKDEGPEKYSRVMDNEDTSSEGVILRRDVNDKNLNKYGKVAEQDSKKKYKAKSSKV